MNSNDQQPKKETIKYDDDDLEQNRPIYTKSTANKTQNKHDEEDPNCCLARTFCCCIINA